MKLATRQSKLALVQSEMAKKQFAQYGLECDFLPMETKGDKPTYPFFIGKGLFVKELQEKLLNGNADIAVHSLKDLPVVQTDHLALVALLPRAAKEDVLVLSPAVLHESGLHDLSTIERMSLGFDQLKNYLYKSKTFLTKKMGTSSLHRKILFQKYFELETTSIRGNVGTRLSKVQNNEYSCTFLAKAGLDRLGLFSADNPSMYVLNPKLFIPSAGQGIIAIEASMHSQDYQSILNVCQKITSPLSCIEAGLERLVLFLLESDCYTPVGVYFNESILSVVTEENNSAHTCEIQLTSDDLNFVETLLQKHHNIYAPFFVALCASNLAKRIQAMLPINSK